MLSASCVDQFHASHQMILLHLCPQSHLIRFKSTYNSVQQVSQCKLWFLLLAYSLTSSVIEAVESCNSFCSTIIDLVATVQMLKNIFQVVVALDFQRHCTDETCG